MNLEKLSPEVQAQFLGFTEKEQKEIKKLLKEKLKNNDTIRNSGNT